MNKRLILIFVLLFAAAVVIGLAKRAQAPLSPTHYNHKISVGSQTLFIDIATTTPDMELGLSNRASMGTNQGMLFKFSSPERPGFWMKDMEFALDFLWINNGKIIAINANAPAAVKTADGKFDDNNLKVYTPPSAIDAVLEVNAGWAEKNRVAVGDAVSYETK